MGHNWSTYGNELEVVDETLYVHERDNTIELLEVFSTCMSNKLCGSKFGWKQKKSISRSSTNQVVYGHEPQVVIKTLSLHEQVE